MSHAQLPPGSGVGGTLLAPSGGVGSGATGMLREREVVRITGKQAIVSFLESQTCFSVLRASGKVVVFDTRIPIQLAFYALVEHGELILHLCLCSYGQWLCPYLFGGGGSRIVEQALIYTRYVIIYSHNYLVIPHTLYRHASSPYLGS